MNEEASKGKWTDRFKKMGVAAFLFFFIKGLVWLAIFFGLGKWLKGFFLMIFGNRMKTIPPSKT